MKKKNRKIGNKIVKKKVVNKKSYNLLNKEKEKEMPYEWVYSSKIRNFNGLIIRKSYDIQANSFCILIAFTLK